MRYDYNKDAIKCKESSSPYGVTKIRLPAHAKSVSFDYKFENLGDGDYAAVYIGNDTLAVLNGDDSFENEFVNTGAISLLDNTSDELTVALFGVNAKNAIFVARNFNVQLTHVFPWGMFRPAMSGGKTQPLPATCDADHLYLCTTSETCTVVGGYWYNNSCNSTPDDGCYPNLPAPVVILTGNEKYEANGSDWVRYELTVQNKDQFPSELFSPAPHLPPCGLNNNSSRTWLDIYDNNDNRLYGFCGLDSLDSFWFAIQSGESPPSSIYIELTDRECNNKYESSLESIFIRADVNGDGEITSTDALLVLKKSEGQDMSETAWIDAPNAGDVNCSGSVDKHDSDLLLRYSVGLEMESTDWCIN
jgi:hypothetical protein